MTIFMDSISVYKININMINTAQCPVVLLNKVSGWADLMWESIAS